MAYVMSGCVPRDYPDGMVCVCNSTFCDEIEKLEDFIAPGTVSISLYFFFSNSSYCLLCDRVEYK